MGITLIHSSNTKANISSKLSATNKISNVIFDFL